MTGPDLIVLVVVVAFLAYYVWRCTSLTRGAGSELRDLLHEFTVDIQDRAKRGQDPDWLRYSEESDREHEYKCESFRNYATTALATGIGGTMFLLFIYLMTAPESGDTIQPLLSAMGLALVASGLGVATNLGILIGLLPRANKRFNSKRKAFLEKLHGICRQNPPTQVGDTVSEGLERVVASAAASFPEVFKTFRESVLSLGEVAGVFSDSTKKMEAATAVLSVSVNELNILPGNLGKQLSEVRQAWTRDVKKNQELYLAKFGEVLDGQNEAVQKTLSELKTWQAARMQAEARWHAERTEAEASWLADRREAEASWQGDRTEAEVRWRAQRDEADARWQEWQAKAHERQDEAVRELVNTTTDVVQAVHGLAPAFRNEIDRAAGSLGRAFGEQARNHVSDLIDATRRENERLARTLDGHVGRLLNEVGGIVQEGVKPTLEAITSAGKDLNTLITGVRKAIEEFREHGESFRHSLDRAADRIGESSSGLVDAHARTGALMGEVEGRYRSAGKILDESARAVGSLLAEVSRSRSKTWRFFGWLRSPARRDARDEPVE